MARNVNIDYIRLSVGHALILGNLPEAIQLSQLNTILLKETHRDMERFGFFESSSPNYTSYYPEVKAEDLVPKEDEYINPIFRALSEVIVHKQWNPVDFGSNPEALKDSQKLLVGQTVNADHETMIGNAMGAVRSVEWQDSYTSNGAKVPAGINAELRIDGKSNPRIARAINSDPPSIHSVSVTVEFEWESSHPNMDMTEFYNKLGQFDEKGNMYRRIVTRVRRYHEISLVSHGADPYAQLIKKDGKINNPKFAHISYNSEVAASKGGAFITMDFKNSDTWYHSDFINNSENTPTSPAPPNIETSKNENTTNMKNYLIQLAASMGITLSFNEAGEISQEQFNEMLTKLAQLNGNAVKLAESAAEQLRLSAEITQLKAGDGGQAQKFVTDRTTELREDTKRIYQLVNKEAKPEILANIESADYTALKALNDTYKEKLEEAMPMCCAKCGSKEVKRSTASPGTEEENKGTGTEQNNAQKSHEEAIAALKAMSAGQKLPAHMNK